MANHVIPDAPSVNIIKDQKADHSRIITERTPFLMGYLDAARHFSDNSQPVYKGLPHATTNHTPGLQSGAQLATSHLYDAGSDVTMSCLSYYDPYHDTTYAAHYAVPEQSFLGGSADDNTEYDTSGSLSGSSVPVVSPGAISTSQTPGNGGRQVKPARDTHSRGHRQPCSERHLGHPQRQPSGSGECRRKQAIPGPGGYSDCSPHDEDTSYYDLDSNRHCHGVTTHTANMDTYPDSHTGESSDNSDDAYGQGDAEQGFSSGHVCLDEQGRPIEYSRSPGCMSSTTDMSYGYLPGDGVLQKAFSPNWKVDYMDFTPEMSGFESGNISCKENLPDLVNRVNYWLTQNPLVEAQTCEMVTWSTSELPQVGDSESMVQARHCEHSPGQDTFNVMGLRLWIVPKTSRGPSQTLAYRDYKAYEGERLSQLIQKANTDMEENPIHGSIISFETVMVPNIRSWDTDWLFWRDSPPGVQGLFNVFLRVYYVSGERTPHRLGIRNIVPEVMGGCHEPFSCLMRRASQWVSSEPGVKVTNLRSTYVSRDNDTPAQAAERCQHYFREFTKQQYYQLLRVFYLCCPSINASAQQKHIINCMTFTPVQSSLGANVQAMFEGMKPTMLRIGAWIRLSGAKIFSLESVITPLIPSQLNHTLPERTHWTPSLTAATESNRKFLVHIRIYIDGEFVDPDPLLLPPLPYSLTKELQNSIEEKELKRFYKKKKMRKTQNRIAIATFMFILVTVALVIIIERMLKKYYR